MPNNTNLALTLPSRTKMLYVMLGTDMKKSQASHGYKEMIGRIEIKKVRMLKFISSKEE
jgi:hypothetical protein